MMKRTKDPLFGLFVVVLLTYFGQVHPYIHFHHSHETTSWPFKLSLHPVDVEPEHIPEHHGDDHHHAYQQYAERGLPIRQQITNVNFPSQLVIEFVWSPGEVSNQPSVIFVDGCELQWRLSNLPSTASLRSPPVSA